MRTLVSDKMAPKFCSRNVSLDTTSSNRTTQGAPTMYETPNTPHAGSLSKIIVQSPEQEQQRRKNNQSSPHLCTVQKHLFSRESNKFTLLCAKNKNNAENNRPMHKWNFKKTVDDNTSGSKNNKAIKSIGYSQCVVRKTIGKSIESSELGHLSKESLDKLVNDRNYCILCSVDSDTFKSKGALRFHYRLKHSKELKEMNSVFSTSVLGKRKSSSSEKTDAVQSDCAVEDNGKKNCDSHNLSQKKPYGIPPLSQMSRKIEAALNSVRRPHNTNCRPRSPPLLIDMRNNQLVIKDHSWKPKVPNSEESDSRSQMSQSPSDSFSLRLSDDEEEEIGDDDEKNNINNLIAKDTPPPMKKQKIDDDLFNGKEESNAFKESNTDVPITIQTSVASKSHIPIKPIVRNSHPESMKPQPLCKLIHKLSPPRPNIIKDNPVPVSSFTTVDSNISLSKMSNSNTNSNFSNIKSTLNSSNSINSSFDCNTTSSSLNNFVINEELIREVNREFNKLIEKFEENNRNVSLDVLDVPPPEEYQSSVNPTFHKMCRDTNQQQTPPNIVPQKHIQSELTSKTFLAENKQLITSNRKQSTTEEKLLKSSSNLNTNSISNSSNTIKSNSNKSDLDNGRNNTKLKVINGFVTNEASVREVNRVKKLYSNPPDDQKTVVSSNNNDVEIVFDKKQQQVLIQNQNNSKQKPKQTADKPNITTTTERKFTSSPEGNKQLTSCLTGSKQTADAAMTKNQIHSAIKAYSRLGATPLCLNLVICPYCKIALFGEHQYQEHLVRFHPESHYLLCKQTVAAAAAAVEQQQQSKKVQQQKTVSLINPNFRENDFITKKIANSFQSKSVQNDNNNVRQQQKQMASNDDQICKQRSKQTATNITQDIDDSIQISETIKKSVCNNYKFKLLKIDVPNDLRSNYRQWKLPAHKVYSYQKYPIPKKNQYQENVLNVNKQLPASEKGTCSITPTVTVSMSKPYLNKPCKPSLRVKPIQPYINNISISSHSSEKWHQEEFQKEKVTSPFIVDKDTSPFLVGRTNSPIILGPHTTLERFEHEILKKDNSFFKSSLNSQNNVIPSKMQREKQSPDVITKYDNDWRKLITSKDSEDFQPIKKPSFSNEKILMNSHGGNSKSLPEMPELVPIEKPNNQTPESHKKFESSCSSLRLVRPWEDSANKRKIQDSIEKQKILEASDDETGQQNTMFEHAAAITEKYFDNTGSNIPLKKRRLLMFDEL